MCLHGSVNAAKSCFYKVFQNLRRFVVHQKDYKIEVYWTRHQVGIRTRAGKSAYMMTCTSFEAGIRLCAEVVATLNLWLGLYNL